MRYVIALLMLSACGPAAYIEGERCPDVCYARAVCVCSEDGSRMLCCRSALDVWEGSPRDAGCP